VAVLAVLALLALVAGPACSGDDGEEGDVNRSPDDGGASLTGPDALVGQIFLSDTVTEDGEPRPLVDGTEIVLSFDQPGHLTAEAGCNTIGADVDVEADRLVTSNVSITEMGCDQALHEQDEWLLDLLVDGPDYTLDGGRLQLGSGGTTIEMVDRVGAGRTVPLEDTRWQLDGLVDGDTAGSVPDGSGATLRFTAGGVAVDVEGCNSGTAPAAVDDDAGTIVFGALRSTLMACAGPAGEVEAAVHAVLVDEVAYTVDGDVLTLTHPSGKGLTLRSAD
jgi:heat shock protein HslJ